MISFSRPSERIRVHWYRNIKDGPVDRWDKGGAMFYEEFEPDKPVTTRKRVVTGTDIDLFTAITGTLNPLFLSDEFAQDAGQKARLTPGPLLLSFAIGLSYQTGILDHVAVP